MIQRHNELRDLEAELLNVVCNDVQIEPVLQEVNGETSNPGSNDLMYTGERQRSAFLMSEYMSHKCRVLHRVLQSYS